MFDQTHKLLEVSGHNEPLPHSPTDPHLPDTTLMTNYFHGHMFFLVGIKSTNMCTLKRSLICPAS